ncbi:hypothetical protein ACFZBP_22400 [Streptomyces sp. NPDC008086]|uniref:hypothetical protein n=1 Tax=Streptomyces sp. NPDC008086 TaxID=3364807 RepID=UPI0036EA2820
MALAPAAHAAEPTDEQIRLAVQRHFNGSWTQEDVALVRSIPELAAVVPDVTRPVEVDVDSVVTNADAVTPADQARIAAELALAAARGTLPPKEAVPSEAGEENVSTAEPEIDPEGEAASTPSGLRGKTRWKMTHITHTHRSYTGMTIFKYHTYAEFQYNGSKVLKWGQRYDDFTDEDKVAGIKIESKRIVNTKSRTPAASASSTMKRQVELCVFKYGCYATLHPWAKVKVYGTGKTKIGGSGV